MRFARSEQDVELGAAVRSMLTAACTSDVIRGAWDAPPGKLDRSVWQGLTDLGVAAVMAPEPDGLGLDERSMVPVLEAVGYAGVPAPVVESTLLAATLVDVSLLGELFSSDLGGNRAPAAADADHLLLGDPDGGVHLVDPDDVDIVPVATTDGARRLGEIRWTPSASTRLPVEPERLDLALDRARLGTAAVLTGVLQRALDMTVGYVRDRHQFRVPIGSFQAVKHHLADAHMTLAFAKPAVDRAAWSLATGDAHRSRDVALAKLLVNQAASVVTRAAVQCHGAIGYTVEYDLHLFVKRAWALREDWGSEREMRTRLGRFLGVPDGRCTPAGA